MQIVYAGKAHPQDNSGKEVIQRIYRAKEVLRANIKIAYLENYNMEIGKLMTAGVDVWLNTPQPPLEASGTSGMKAAINGVPSFSVLDGWWAEGCIEGVTGWSIGSKEIDPAGPANHTHDAASLYDKLEGVIVPLFYQNREWLSRCHAPCDCAQRFVFQHPPHAAAICVEGVLLNIMKEEGGRITEDG